MTEEELQPLVDSWREANPNIVPFLWDVDRAVKDCIRQRVPTETHGLHFDYRSAMLFITLPSGRRLAYVKPRIGENQFGGESVTYMGCRRYEEMGTAGKLWPQVCREHRPGYRPAIFFAMPCRP